MTITSKAICRNAETQPLIKNQTSDRAAPRTVDITHQRHARISIGALSALRRRSKGQACACQSHRALAHRRRLQQRRGATAGGIGARRKILPEKRGGRLARNKMNRIGAEAPATRPAVAAYQQGCSGGVLLACLAYRRRLRG